jgi:hypothetical protein
LPGHVEQPEGRIRYNHDYMQISGRFCKFPKGILCTPALVIVPLLVAALSASGCSGDDSTDRAVTTTPTTATTTAGAPETIRVLGSRKNTGPFQDSLSLKLVPTGSQPFNFYVCAAWGGKTAPSDCTAPPGARLPAGSRLRLEQRPPGPAMTSADSPGWGTVGTSDTPELSIPLSNGVTGNRFGKVTYRVTLRNQSGRVLATSNTFKLTWHG